MVLTRSMATTNNGQGDEPLRYTALERQVQTLMAVVERLMIWRNNYVKEMHDTIFKRKTRVTIPNEGDPKGQTAVTSPVDPNGGTSACPLSWVQPRHLFSRRCKRGRNKWRL